jgi:hypothetical protein
MREKISIYLDQHPQGGVVIEYPLSAIDKRTCTAQTDDSFSLWGRIGGNFFFILVVYGWGRKVGLIE